jgi:uncharacterized protein
MIIVLLKQGSGNRIRAFTASGHAGTAPRGQDIVCAAVSVLTQTAILAVARLSGVEPDWDRGRGLLKFRLPTETPAAAAEIANVVLESMAIGLRSVAEAYPGNLLVLRLRRRWGHAV